jgi:Tol biopolymer transport system component/predicted Ser/Thr protein kinase
MIGRELGHFRLTESIGAGGMGVVYKATDLRLKRTVAIKLLPTELAQDPDRRARLLREARAASSLNHPNIVTVHEIDSAEGIDFVAMEFVEGRSLDRLIGADGLALREALEHAAQIARALAAAHGRGVLHRDLKPGNVMVTPEGQVKVVDFGLAKRLPVPATSAVPTETAGPRSAEGSLAGTVAYMSPEQAQGRPLDARSDLFALGVVLFEMLTGRRPFQADNAAALLGSILRDDPPSARGLRPSLPRALDPVLARLLAKDPDRRYQTAGELAADLERLASLPSTARSGRGRRVAIAAAGLALAAALAWFLVHGRPPVRPFPRVHLLSTFPGSHRAPSLSPDGRMVAFVETARGVPQIWLKHLGEGEPIQLTTGDVPAARPRFSPKGDEIVFERRREGIWSVPPLGGAARRVLEAGTCPSFFPDGERLAFDKGTELWTARLDGGEARRVEGVPENYFSFYLKRCAAVSPDGRQIAYFQPQRGLSGDFWIVPASGGQPRRLTSDVVPGGSPVFSADGRFVIFSSSRGGSRTLWHVPVTGGDPEPLTTGAGEDDEPELSRDGRTLVYTNSRHSWALMLHDAGTGRERTVLERRGHVAAPVFSPDGGRLAFFAWTDEREQLFVVGVDGQDLRQVTRGPDPSIMPRWSPEGASLFFYREEPPAFCRVPVAGGRVEPLIDGWRWESQLGSWLDPGGARLAYALVENGRPRAARVRDLGSGREHDLAQAIFVGPWSPDGLTVAGNTEAGEVVVCPADGRACREVVAGRSPRWSHDGRRIFFTRRGRPLDDPALKSEEAWVVNADGAEPRRLAILEPQHVLATPFEISARGDLAWVQFRRGKQELWLAELH